MPQNLIAIKIAQSAVLAAASTVASGVSIAIQLSTQVTLPFDMVIPSLSLGGNYIEFIGKTMIIDEAYLR